VTYTDAVKLLEKSGKKFEFPVAWGLDLQKEHEKYLVEVRFFPPAGFPSSSSSCLTCALSRVSVRV
jgi:aspartyl/asparaginyl-tRNA synthetase